MAFETLEREVIVSEVWVESQPTSRTIILAWLICGLGALYYCYEYFLRIAPSIMTSDLMKTYDLNGAQVGNLAAFYYHAYVPMQIIVGLLMDRYGPRRLLTFACLLCAVGTYMFASGQSLAVAQGGRFLVGLGSAFAFVGALKLATIWLPPNRFALVSGIIMCLGMLGAMAGDILLRILVDSIGWNFTNYFSALAGVFLAAILWTALRDSNPYQARLHAHFQVTSFKSLMQGLLAALGNKQIWLVGLVGLFLYTSLSAFAELWGIPFLMQAHGLTKTQAAAVNSMVFLGWAVGAPFWGWFSDYVQLRKAPIIGSAIGALVSVCCILYFGQLSLVTLYLLMFAYGFLSSSQILIFAICREVSSIRITGTAVALTNMVVMIGGNFLQPVIGTLLDLHWASQMVDGARVYPLSAYSFALSVLPITIILGILTTLFLRETHCKIPLEE